MFEQRTEVFGAATSPEPAPTGFALHPGEDLQLWTITARVNTGVNAHVYRARDHDAISGRDVALKVLLPQSAHGRQDQVVHEVAAMSSLTLGHPHLMSATTARRITTGPYTGGVLIVMPWAELNLREYVLAVRRRDPLPDGGRCARPAAMCEALAGIADGLAHLHQRNTAHGDVKPDNIMLVDGVWKLGDFGLTRPMEGSYVLSAPGTLSYTAPEEARAQHADPAAEIKRRPAGDVWALGVTLHFAVTGGRFPMPGINPDERLAAVRQGDIRINPDIAPKELQSLLRTGFLIDDRHAGPHSYEHRITAARAGEALRRIATREQPRIHRLPIDPALDTEAQLRYQSQCERMAGQTAQLWRDLGPWDSSGAATTARSRGVLGTMLTNRLAAIEPPPELCRRKSILARGLGLQAPFERCRDAVRAETVAEFAPPLTHSGRFARRLLLLLTLGVFATPVATALISPGRPTPLLAALALVVLGALLSGLLLGGEFPEPAYVGESRAGPVAGAAAGFLIFIGVYAGGVQITVGGSGSGVRIAALVPAAVTLALLGWYVAGVLVTRRAVAPPLPEPPATS